MDNKTYEVLLSKLKTSLDCDIYGSSSNYFNKLILECKLHIEESLCVAMNCIDSMNHNMLLSCLDNISCILQMLSDFIRKVLESIPFVCSNMKSYPTAAGSIILSVFDHCKTSECVYGEYLNKVQRQLKELFRACHELQLTYLMTLEKHFTFDLSQTDDLYVLLETLDLNLKIGEAVENLDIKTMAEQWKAYTALCDKYCKYIEDSDIFTKCADMLCKMIKSNLQVTLEMKADGGDKAVVRPVKVACFAIKILTKVCNIFKRVTHNNNEIIDLLIFLNMHNRSYMQTFLETTFKVINLIEDSIRDPLETLLTALVANHTFIEDVCRVKGHELDNEKYFGYTILVANIMKALLKHSQVPGEMKLNLVSRMFHLLASGHTWFNVGLKVVANNKSFGLFEYVLTISLAFARTLSADQYAALERLLFRSLLAAESYSGLFAADLWILLMRSSSSDSKLVVESTLSLLKVYQSLAGKRVFQQSPQNVYLSYVIRNLFTLCTKQDKCEILNSYKIEEFFDLWAGVELSQIVGRQQNVVSLFTPMLKGCLASDEIANSGKRPASEKEEISETVVALWKELRPCECNKAWTCKRIERIMALTEAFTPLLADHVVLKVHNAIGEMLKSGNEDVVFVLFQKYCLLYEKGDVTPNSLEEDVFVKLLKSNDEIRQHLFLTLQRFPKTEQAIRRNPTLLHLFAEYNYKSRYPVLELRSRLRSVESTVFSHKCVAVGKSGESKGKSNFDLNIESLFDEAEEPSSKKLKLNDADCGDLISRLEEDVRRLQNVKEVLSEGQKLKLSNLLSRIKSILES